MSMAFSNILMERDICGFLPTCEVIKLLYSMIQLLLQGKVELLPLSEVQDSNCRILYGTITLTYIVGFRLRRFVWKYCPVFGRGFQDLQLYFCVYWMLWWLLWSYPMSQNLCNFYHLNESVWSQKGSHIFLPSKFSDFWEDGVLYTPPHLLMDSMSTPWAVHEHSMGTHAQTAHGLSADSTCANLI